MNERRRPVLVLGADSPIGLTVVRELGARGVPVIAHGRSERALGRFSRYARSFVLDTRPLGDWLPDYAAAQDLGAIMAVSEGHLIELAALKGRIACKVLTPDADRLASVLDKARTLEAARKVGIAVPEDWQPAAGQDFAARAAAISYPVAIKWADPNAVQDRLAAEGIAFEKVEYAKDAAQLAAILARYDAIATWPLVQQYCPGHGLGQMLHMANGHASLKFQHRRLREFPPSGGVSSFCASVPPVQHAAQMLKSENLLAELGWEGPAMVEYRFDPATGTYWLMEVNGRFWGSIPLAWHCGAHFAWETYSSAVDGKDGGQGPYRQRRARYVIPDAKRTAIVLKDGTLPPRARIGALLRFVADFFDPRVRYYVWSLRDPGPFFGDLAGIARRLLRRG
ncbi:MAG: carboxylate--amine ligase [Novosphingobium sp.]